jgi:murein DD-endopeptidase MepM/ murein hydrolase activator NlpD
MILPLLLNTDLLDLLDKPEPPPIEYTNPTTEVIKYIEPAKGTFTSGYGKRWGKLHKGIDIAAPVGTPIYAAQDGVVISSGWNSGGYGNLIKIEHPNKEITLYAHNSSNLVKKGDIVTQGQVIATMGSTGFSTGPHLHFEIRNESGKAIDPYPLIFNGKEK